METKLSYEAALVELQAIVSSLEGEQIGMDELTQKVSRAAELLAYCQNKLKLTEETVKRKLIND